VEWVQGHERAIIPLDQRFVLSRSLRAKVRKRDLVMTSDQAFDRVIRECGKPTRQRPETWLCEEIIEIFEVYHKAGIGHSVEAWREAGGDRVLVGGLYGVALGGVFCGESMFSRPELGGSNASKVCLVHLVGHLRRHGFSVLDSQLSNDHIAQFGSFEIPGREYVKLLKAQTSHELAWGEWNAERTVQELALGAGPPAP
jgi:leucyl/phenylalanyl-tRNA--protein transferase